MMIREADRDLLVVGITGRSGSGKSSLARYYASLGYPVQDGDEVSRRITQPGSSCLHELVGAFGNEILQPDGTLNRAQLGKIVFDSPQHNDRLVAITHPYIIREMLAEIQQAEDKGSPLFFIDGAMIVGGPVQPYCDKIIVLVAEHSLSISRIILRDGISKIAAGKRLDAQLSEQQLRAAADYTIENNDGEQALAVKADAVLAQLLQAAALPVPRCRHTLQNYMPKNTPPDATK